MCPVCMNLLLGSRCCLVCVCFYNFSSGCTLCIDWYLLWSLGLEDVQAELEVVMELKMVRFSLGVTRRDEIKRHGRDDLDVCRGGTAAVSDTNRRGKLADAANEGRAEDRSDGRGSQRWDGMEADYVLRRPLKRADKRSSRLGLELQFRSKTPLLKGALTVGGGGAHCVDAGLICLDCGLIYSTS